MPVVFHLTGFGSFLNVASNPTEHLINDIKTNVDKWNSDKYKIASTRVSNVSAIEVLQTLLQLQTDFVNTKETGQITIFVHLGVHSMAEVFNLERTAYNTAEWDTKDTKNWVAGKSQIYESELLDAPRSTRLPLEAIADSLGNKHPCLISTNPGRYLCNYIYYNSLTITEKLEGVHSLFVHVPPFSVIPAEEQKNTLKSLLDIIATLLQ